jgi:RNA polymerase sigma-70 factor (ECF subfamily)
MGVLKGTFSSENHPGETMSDISFEALFNEFFDRLVYFSWQLVNDKDHARDIVQDAFIKYWNQRDSVIPNKTAAKNFLYSTVRNASLNSIRHNKVVDDFIRLQGGGEPEHPPVIDAIINAEVISQIHAALQSLPASYRSVSVLSYFEGKKNGEIADDLDMSVNTVKKQKQRALQLLRMKLTPEMMVLVVAIIAKCLL